MTVTDEQIGESVHQLMWRQRVTQRALAERLGMTQPGLSKKMRGQRPWLATELASIAAEFDTTIDELVRHQGLEPRTRWLRACPELVAA